MKTIFIHTNNKQLLGAKLSDYSIRRTLRQPSEYTIQIINVDDLPAFKDFANTSYLRHGHRVTYNPLDLQSFTLTRFLPPELMKYQGQAVVMDPDIFALGDVGALFDLLKPESTVLACPKKNAWDSSVMAMNCEKLPRWNTHQILTDLRNGVDYADWMTLKNVEGVQSLSRLWNNLDTLTPDTKLIHLTNRLTQPWKTGLPIDFQRNPLPKLFGFIPREPLYRLMGKMPTTYQAHPDQNIQRWFCRLVKDALHDRAITQTFVESEISKRHVRPDLLEFVETLTA